jgi:polar amino acid transport system substrate-binding protein
MHRRSVLPLVLLAAGPVALTACANHPTSSAQPTYAAPTITDKPDAKIQNLLPAAIRKRGVVNVAINPDVPPVKYLGSNNDVQGLIPELLRRAGARAGVRVHFSQTSFDALIPGLTAKRYDVIASEGDFKEREKQVDFIDYMRSGVGLLVLKANPKHIHGSADLCGTRVAFVRGTLQQDLAAQAGKDCVAKGEKPVEANGYQDSGGAELALRSGQADADWADSPDAAFRAKQNPGRYAVAKITINGMYGIGFRKEDRALLKTFRAGLLSLAEDGSYRQAMKKYGLSDVAMPSFPINNGPRQGS